MERAKAEPCFLDDDINRFVKWQSKRCISWCFNRVFSEYLNSSLAFINMFILECLFQQKKNVFNKKCFAHKKPNYIQISRNFDYFIIIMSWALIKRNLFNYFMIQRIRGFDDECLYNRENVSRKTWVNICLGWATKFKRLAVPSIENEC